MASDGEWQARIAQVRAHPNFPRAMRAAAAGLCSHYQGGPLLNWLMDDRARLLFGYLALHLHFSRDPADSASGLTPTRMKQLCTRFGLCSAGRAAAMLSLMRFSGYLAPDPDNSDGRSRRLVATPELLALLRSRWRANFSGATMLFDDGDELIARLDDDAFVRAFLAAMFERFNAGYRLLAYTPGLGVFSERAAGMMVMTTLISSGEDDDTVPPSRPVVLSISELSRRFSVSRVHVAKMLRDAAADGLITRGGNSGEAITLAPALKDALQLFIANALLFFFDSARAAAASLKADRAAAKDCDTASS
ncbi:hypothetical protein [Rhodopseudomonas sp. B29]|uniref:hypothetical protein n=1 Tax=Rhodopseudomonas sp. B29 TaxID=95607 RepID=UPI00034D1B4B|nr:hypothetical protein [Rhodopseudomonas sp. B29]